MMFLLTSDDLFDKLDWQDLMGIIVPTKAVRAAVMLLTIGPIVLAYPFLQRHFVKGIFVGGLKG